MPKSRAPSPGIAGKRIQSSNTLSDSASVSNNTCPTNSRTSMDSRKLLYCISIEILIMILGHLERKDWKQFRLVSRFSKEIVNFLPLITVVWFSPQTEDLRRFRAICHHPDLGQHVNTLIYDHTETCLTLFGSAYEGMMLHRQVSVNIDSHDSQSLLHSTYKKGVKLLPKLSHIAVSHASRYSHRGTGEILRSPHYKQTERQSGRGWCYCTPFSSEIQRLLLFTPYHDRARIQRLEIKKMSLNIGSHEDGIIDLPSSQLAARNLDHLRRVDISIRNLDLKFRPELLRSSLILRFLKGARNLESLHLVCPQGYSNYTGEWYENKDYYRSSMVDTIKVVFEGATWPRLRKLHLNAMTTHAETLIDVLRRHACSLETLVLEEIHFRRPEDNWQDVTRFLKNHMQLKKIRGESRSQMNEYRVKPLDPSHEYYNNLSSVFDLADNV